MAGNDPLHFDPRVAGPAASREGPALNFPVLAEGLDLALHYGWFAVPSKAGETLEALREGQGAFTAELMKLVPPAARRVLDVGTGRGETARALAAGGAEVLTLSPDPNQGRWLARVPHPGIAYRQSRFEDLAPDGAPFDAVVFSESSNYVTIDNLLAHSASLTVDSAALVIAAPFLRAERSQVHRDMHPASELRAKVERSAWMIREEHDFTEQVAPTLRIGRLLVERRVVPSVRAIDRYLANEGPLALRLLCRLLAPYRRRGLELLEQRLPALLDEETFVREVAFLFLRLEKAARC